MKKLGYCLLFCACLLGSNAFAQTESTLYFMNSLPQVVDANPAIMPRYRLTVGLPIISSVGAIYSNNGFNFNNIVTKSNGVVSANLSKWTQSLAENNYVTVAAQTDLLRVGVRLNPKLYLTVSSTAKAYSRSMIPRGLVSLLVDGTAPIVGTFSNTAPQEEAVTFIQTNLGLAYQASSKLTIGGRLKYLNGINNVTTESSSLVVQVGDTYQITATGSANVRTSGINNLGRSGYNVADHLGDYFKNSGWGVDLGATYKVMEKLTVGVSLTDIGYIKWTNNTYQYTLDPATAKYTFSGFDMNKLLNKNSTYLSAELDSIKNKFQMKESANGSYTTMLPGKLYINGTYMIIPNLSAGMLFFTEKFRGRTSSGITAAVNKNFGKWVSTSLTYTVSNRSYNNIGLGLSFNVAPVQLYIVGDNLLGAPASLVTSQNLDSYLNSAQLLTVRVGLNFVFGWDKGLGKDAAVKEASHNPKQKTSNAKVKNTYGRSPTKKKSKVGR